MSTPNIDRAALAELLASYGDSLESFDALRPDAYEQCLAREPGGLEYLRSFYAEIMRPGQTQEQAAAKCPTWPLGSKRERQRPSTNIVSQVSERLRTKAALTSIKPVGKFLTELRRELKATPLGDNQAILDGVCGAVGQKLMSDIRAGSDIDLKAMQALQSQRIIEQNDLRLKQNATKLEQSQEQLGLATRRVKLLEDQRQAALDAISNAKKSKGGITKETLDNIEQTLKLL